ncbi:MAG: hypothetical protein JJU28_01280 [Cyclobacteriaceae bacterium]|nr:hypothetical protein [Cyclobacteriaceae bacterium]
MNDLEFDVLDELYFIQSFQYLKNVLNLEDQSLKETLLALLTKGWIKCYKTNQDEIYNPHELFDNEYQNFYYLATKSGLLAHNTLR